MKKLRETGNPPTNCKLGEKTDEIVDWINQFEDVKIQKIIENAIKNAMKNVKIPIVFEEKPIEKKCENCQNLRQNPLHIDCIFPYYKTEDCLTNNYKYFEAK